MDKKQKELVKESVEFFRATVDARSKDADGFLGTFHVIKNGKIYHYFTYEKFPIGDFPKAVTELAVESRRAESVAATGRSKA